MASRVNKKRKFIADGVLFAEINELLTRELIEGGYAGVEIRNAPMRTEIIIRASRPQDVLGEKGKRIRELTSVIQKRFGFADGAVELFAERVPNRGLSAQAQADSLKYKLLGGLAVRRACYGIIRFVMEAGAKGVEVVVAGKLRGQRAKAMKFRDGYMVKTGNSAVLYQVRCWWQRPWDGSAHVRDSRVVHRYCAATPCPDKRFCRAGLRHTPRHDASRHHGHPCQDHERPRPRAYLR